MRRSTITEGEGRAIVAGLALAIIALSASGLAQATQSAAGPQGGEPRLLTVCGAGRMTDADLAIEGDKLSYSVLCVFDATGRYDRVKNRVPLNLSLGDRKLGSVHAAERIADFKTTEILDGAGQVGQISQPGKGTCVTVTATSQAPRPVPRRFIAQSGDWQASMDYQIDDQCQVLAVLLGDRIALVSTASPASFDLYRVQFVVSSKGSTP